MNSALDDGGTVSLPMRKSLTYKQRSNKLGHKLICVHVFLKFDVQGSVHRKYIPLDTFPTRCNITQIIYFWKNALHVSGGNSTHYQKHIQLYLQHLVLVNRYCYLPLWCESWSWSECGVEVDLFWCGCNRTKTDKLPHPTQSSSNSSTIAAGSSNSLTSTRCCKYSCMCS